MPFGLVRQLQTDPNRFTGVGAIGCVGHQFGAHLTRGDDRASIGTGAKLGYGGRAKSARGEQDSHAKKV